MITGSAVMQIFLLGAVGYFLVKRNVLGQICLDTLSRLVIEVTLPALIFYQLITEFKFNLYTNWWIFPLISFAITLAGFLSGAIFTGFIRGRQQKWQFLSLTTFQNSGYLPLVLAASLLAQDKMNTMFVYIFMFLLGFNLLIWSLGVYILSFHKNKGFEFGSLFSPPVIATLVSLLLVFFRLNQFIPQLVLKPLQMIGNCTFVLAIFVVGGSLALAQIKNIDFKAVSLMVLAKLIILPALGLWLVIKFNLPALLGLLIVMETAAPSATSLSVITRHYKNDDLLVSQGIFFTHILSLITLPVFLSLYFALGMIQWPR